MRMLDEELDIFFRRYSRIADRIANTTIEVIEVFHDVEFENPHGIVTAKKGDFIAKDVSGNPYPIDRKTFFQTYKLRDYS